MKSVIWSFYITYTRKEPILANFGEDKKWHFTFSLIWRWSTWVLTYPEWIFIKVWGFTFHHFNCHNPQRPDINFWTISFSSHHLRCHPIGSSHHSASFTLLRGDLGTEPKISCREEKSVKISSNYISFTIGHFQIWLYFPLLDTELLQLPSSYPFVPDRSSSPDFKSLK